MKPRLFASLVIVLTIVVLADGEGTVTPADAQGGSSAEAAPTVTSYDAQGAFRVNGRRFFPIGLTMPPPLGSTTPRGTDAVDELVDAGVTVFRAGPLGGPWTEQLLQDAQAWNDAAAGHGVYTWIHLRELAEALPGSAEEAELLRVVATLKDSPGMGLWKGVDEPWPRLAPEELAHAYAVVKQADPAHVFHTIFGPFSLDDTMLLRPPDPPDLRPYNEVTDTHGVNVYPVYYHLQGARQPRLHMVGRWMAALRGATGRNALTMTLQICFAGSDDPAGSGAFILPTKRQERYMTYDAIINGARGLFFFGGRDPICHNARDAALGWNWTFWDTVLEDLVREIGEGSPLYPALLRPETTVKLRTSGETTQAISRRVGSRVLWVLAAHNGSRAETVTIRGLPPWARTGRLYPSGQKVVAKEGRIRQPFLGWGVRAIRFTR